MRSSSAEEAVLSREELDALLEEMPKVVSDREADIDSHRPRYAEVDLHRREGGEAQGHGPHRQEGEEDADRGPPARSEEADPDFLPEIAQGATQLAEHRLALVGVARWVGRLAQRQERVLGSTPVISQSVEQIGPGSGQSSFTRTTLSSLMSEP